MKRVLIVIGAMLMLSFGMSSCSKSDEIINVDVPDVPSTVSGTEDTPTNVSNDEKEGDKTPADNPNEENGDSDFSTWGSFTVTFPTGESFYVPIGDAEIEYVTLDSLPEWIQSWVASAETSGFPPKSFLRKLDSNITEGTRLFRGEWNGAVYYLIWDCCSSSMFDAYNEDGSDLETKDDEEEKSFFSVLCNMKRIYLID